MKTAILAGATGLIGSQLLPLLLREDSYNAVIALSRKPLMYSHSKLQNIIIDFDTLENNANQLKGDDVFCCLGTTMKQAGSQQAFRKVDLEYPVSLATISRRQGATQFLLVTAMGANKGSSIFYNRVKGEVQEAIESIGFETFRIFQPSMLVGPRIGKRAGERIGRVMMTAFSVLIPKKYKAIESIKVARAMVTLSKQVQRGIIIHESGELQSH